MIEDYCEFFKKIEENPEIQISGLTVREYLLLRAHLHSCQDCHELAERVNAKYPENETDNFSKN